MPDILKINSCQNNTRYVAVRASVIDGDHIGRKSMGDTTIHCGIVALFAFPILHGES